MLNTGSCHYFIRRNGEVIQMVEDLRVAACRKIKMEKF